MTLKLLVDDVTDPPARENFKRLEAYARGLPLNKGMFKFFALSLAAASYPATISVPHTLGFVPKDVIQTSIISAGTVTWEYTQFTRTALVFTITNSAEVRAFIGLYSEEQTT